MRSLYQRQPFKLLQDRRLLYYVSNPRLLEDHEALLPRDSSCYLGIDPTADSIHLGNFVSFLVLNHLRLAGYAPILIFGGATGLIGDPSGRQTERQLMLTEQVEHNISKFEAQFNYLIGNLDAHLGERFGITDLPKFRLVNNHDFYKDMSVVTFLRDVGVHFRLASMLSRDSVKQRLDAGMSFTEFSYQLFQGYDFLRLRQLHNCRLQLGGSDQWGNIASGCELIRRVTGEEAFGATVPLLVDSKGHKLGKSEGNALWLDP